MSQIVKPEIQNPGTVTDSAEAFGNRVNRTVHEWRGKNPVRFPKDAVAETAVEQAFGFGTQRDLTRVPVLGLHEGNSAPGQIHVPPA
jgi:hypothetical protein